MKQGTRTLIVLGTLLAAMVVGACGSRRPPVVTPPLPPCVATVTPSAPQVYQGHLSAGTRLEVGQTLRSVNQRYTLVLQGDGNLVIYDAAADGASLWATATSRPPGRLEMQGDGNLVLYDACDIAIWTAGPLTPGATLTLQDDGNLVLIAAGAPLWASGSLGADLPWTPPPPPLPPHPDPVVDAIRVQGNGECFADGSGCRTFTIVHVGDLPLRWHAGGEAAVLRDLDDMAAVGDHIVRMWSYMRPDGGVWSRGGDPPYPGLDALHKPDFVPRQVALLNAIAARGMRGTLEAGGIAGISHEQEREVMRRFNQALRQAGAWKVAWVAPVNEPSSGGIGDDDGDVDPRHLRELVDIARAGTSVLWHLGHANNGVWNDSRNRWSQKNFTPSDQPFGYYHAWRGGEFDDQARHRFSWLCPDCDEGGDTPGARKRLWVDGEGVGIPTCERSLRCVSVARNGHQLDAEAQSLIVAVQSLRGIGSFMSGTGVQRYQPFTAVDGFAEVPWTVRQLPRDVHTFRTFVHGGRSNAVFKAVTQGNALLRVEQSIGDNGTTAAVAYSDREWQTWSVPVTRAMRVKVCNPGPMTCAAEVRVPAGGRVDLGRIRWGRVLIARPQ